MDRDDWRDEVIDRGCYQNLRNGKAMTPDTMYQRIDEKLEGLEEAVDSVFWPNRQNGIPHCLFAGSYARGTLIDFKNVDVLAEIPDSYFHSGKLSSNGKSLFKTSVKSRIEATFPNCEIEEQWPNLSLSFLDGVLIKLRPAYRNGNGGLYFFDHERFGPFMATSPDDERKTMWGKNKKSKTDGLLFYVCESLRLVSPLPRTLPGILIDSLAYDRIDDNVSWPRQNDRDSAISLAKIRLADLSIFYSKWKSRDFSDPLPVPDGSNRKVMVNKFDALVLGRAIENMWPPKKL